MLTLATEFLLNDWRFQLSLFFLTFFHVCTNGKMHGGAMWLARHPVCRQPLLALATDFHNSGGWGVTKIELARFVWPNWVRRGYCIIKNQLTTTTSFPLSIFVIHRSGCHLFNHKQPSALPLASYMTFYVCGHWWRLACHRDGFCEIWIPKFNLGWYHIYKDETVTKYNGVQISQHLKTSFWANPRWPPTT